MWTQPLKPMKKEKCRGEGCDASLFRVRVRFCLRTSFTRTPRVSLLLLLAEQAEAFLFVLLLVLLSLAGTRLGGERDDGRQRLSTG